MLMDFYHVNLCYQLIKGYLGRELQDMEKVLVYTTGRYLTEFGTNTGFNAAKAVKGKFISGSFNDSSKLAEPSIILSGTAVQEKNDIVHYYFSADFRRISTQTSISKT